MENSVCIKVIHQTSGQNLSNCTRSKAEKLVKLNRAIWLDEETILLITSRRDFAKTRERKIQIDHRICYICDRFIPSHEVATIDHVLPKKLGGTDDDWNLRCCCNRCNHFKAGLTLDFFIEQIKNNRRKYSFISNKQLQRLESYAYQFQYFIEHNQLRK